ncbi:hypothetical protein [Butyrivibrio sp. NC3005]|uniref:hypothetical protein n=1 Tax=Butyrivibrio sp. NC3005 TaxID=1280685 RepID=UPI0012DE6AC1|nr:hypothetical protein [Butyrivibrio sp. NC3005]
MKILEDSMSERPTLTFGLKRQDFFADNKGASLDDAIRCWKYKKSLKGQNKYERSNLKVLEQ